MSILDTAEYRRLALIAAGVDPCDIPCILDTAAWRRLMLAALYDLSQGGGGSPGYINGSVRFYADLPVTVGTPAVNTAYLVRENSGVWFINRKPAGIYVRLFNNGTLDDWDYAGTFPEVNDAQYFRIYDSADPTREVAFNVSGVSAATTRTITMPDANVTLPDQGTSTGDSPTFAQVTINDTVNEVSTLTFASDISSNKIEFATQELTLRHTGTAETPYINVTDGTDYALLGVRQGDMFLQGSNAVVRIEKTGGAVADIKVNKLVLEDATTAGDPTATFDADGNLTASRTYDLPDASGVIALTSNFASPPAIGNTTRNTVAATTMSATGAITGAVAGTTSATSGCNGFQIPVPAAGGSSAVGMYGTFSSGSQRAVIFGANTSGSTSTIADFSASGLVANSIQNTPIGGTTPSTGAFTTLSASTSLDIADGSRTALPFRLASETNNGFYRRAANTLTFVNGGSNRFEISGTQVRLEVNQSFNWVSNDLTGSADLTFVREAADTLGQRRTTNAQEYRLYGTFTAATNYQRMTVKAARQTLSALSGAATTTTGTFIPDGAVVVGVTTRVTTLLAGATGYTIGDGTDADRWGDITGTAVGTTSDNRDWTAGTIECFTAGGNITLTAKTSNFTAGAIEICVFYLAGEAD